MKEIEQSARGAGIVSVVRKILSKEMAFELRSKYRECDKNLHQKLSR